MTALFLALALSGAQPIAQFGAPLADAPAQVQGSTVCMGADLAIQNARLISALTTENADLKADVLKMDPPWLAWLALGVGLLAGSVISFGVAYAGGWLK